MPTPDRYRQIVESVTEFAVIATDLNGAITEWNSGAERILGWTAADAVGRNAAMIFTPEDRAAGRMTREMTAALEERRGFDERWHMKADGSRFWASGEMMPLRSEDGFDAGFVKILRDRTERHLADVRLDQMEAKLREAEEAGGVGLFTLEIASGLVLGAPQFSRLYGLEHKAVRPAAELEDLVVGADRDLVSNDATRRAGEARKDVEYRIRRGDTGETRWIARKGEFKYDEQGHPIQFAGVARDVTEQRYARDALARSEERYRALFEAVDDGFCIIEFLDGPHGPASDYVHIEANAGYERHTGISDIVGRTLRDLAPGEAEGWLAIYGDVLRTGKSIRFERDFVTVGRVIEVSAARIEPPSRRQVLVLFRDISDRKRVETALRASEALVQENAQRVQLALAAGAIIGTWFWDMTSDRFTVDEAFARAFGLDPALGRSGLSLEQVVATVHPDDKDGLASAMGEAIARGGPYAHQYRVRRADGRYYWLEANGRVDLAADGTPLHFPGVLIDVDERRTVVNERDRAFAELKALNETLEQRVAERSAELMQAEEQLRQSQKMEAVGQLTGGLAHDFNNLLAGISGSLELLQTRLAQGRIGEIDRYMVAAQGAAKRAAALTHRLLAFSRRQTLEPKPTDVNRLVAGMEELIRRTVGPQIAVETVATGGLWSTLVDPNQLENALLNLCINARDAMPDGGKLTIEMANRILDDRNAQDRDMAAGAYVSLCVSDNGTGMAPEVVERAFDPFFTTKPIGVGTGLGLSMIYGFAKQSGGQVRIHSKVGQGTTVCLYLPRHDIEERAESVPSSPSLDGAGHGETVLVIDDEPLVRMLIVDVLEELGYRVIEAGDGPGGMKVLRSDARIDLLITDVGLPNGMNGRQVADAARSLRPGLKVLFVTGYAENAVLSHGHLEPGMHIVTKPFTMEALATRIRALISEN